jgi:MOSC domain-containing protein YiiM
MKVVSVNVGLPHEVAWNGKIVRTGIFKKPVAGPIAVVSHNLAGDGQADLSVHGGVTKAVYCYPAEHYAFWREEYPELDFVWGQFGENLSVEGLDEGRLCIGDRLRIGTAEFMVTEPRMPCFKLGVRFGRMDVVKRFLDARRPGFYLAVVSPGSIEAGSLIERLSADPRAVSVRDIVRVHIDDTHDWDTMTRALDIECLPAQWREEFKARLREKDGK